ncbi:uncharacterized protein NEPG_00194 [Nematocida parisii ERTm1]|uniref:uncharacterized protein n=1 Tax=Nematocida parisii (strain ERTm1 / ATCC PRA-289) TaxID=881290 RepID=UPI000264B409|nr:uncharacterized protein NEPG_00194 [Nematocida parisii ERTm1]EIJ94671.1 hypothetical protein NEPG_00194 [Nematocida parisii ERTm1]KAI5158145.1 hypothetical protein NEPAR05_1908 [Nematocida parisii]|eukprot:XP_013058027.1 hypothetical protein NEPG_00194 [Nematocida parisii ERTm1]
MEYSVESLFLQRNKHLYIISYVDGAPMSVCVICVYPKPNVIYIKRFESASKVRGLSRMVLIESLRRLLIHGNRPEIYVYSRPIGSKYIHTERPISHSIQLCAYWESILTEIGYSTMRLTHKEAKSKEFKNIISEHKGIAQCLGKIIDEPISRAMRHASESSLDEIMVILCSSRDLTSGSLIFSKPAEEPSTIMVQKTPEKSKDKKEESSDKCSFLNQEIIQNVTRDEILKILKDLQNGNTSEELSHMKKVQQIIESGSIPKKEPIKPFKLTIKRPKTDRMNNQIFEV